MLVWVMCVDVWFYLCYFKSRKLAIDEVWYLSEFEKVNDIVELMPRIGPLLWLVMDDDVYVNIVLIL